MLINRNVHWYIFFSLVFFIYYIIKLLTLLPHSGGLGDGEGLHGEEGTLTGKKCPKGPYGTFCVVTCQSFVFDFLYDFHITC